MVNRKYRLLNQAPVALSAEVKTVRLSDYLRTIPETHSIAVFVGAMARGRDDFADDIVDEKISISNYSLSASVACGKVRVLFAHRSRGIRLAHSTTFQFCCALEDLWDIV